MHKLDEIESTTAFSSARFDLAGWSMKRRPLLVESPLHRTTSRKLLLNRNCRATRVLGAEIAQGHAKRCADTQGTLRIEGHPSKQYALAQLARSVVMYDRAIDALQALRQDAEANP